MGAARDEERTAETRDERIDRLLAAVEQRNQTWYTLKEAAEYLRTTAKALQHHVDRGTLVPDTHGGRGRTRGHRFSRATLDAFMRGEKAA